MKEEYDAMDGVNHPLQAQGSYQHFLTRQMQTAEESLREGRALTLQELRELREAIQALTKALHDQRERTSQGFRGDDTWVQAEWTDTQRQRKNQQESWNHVWDQIAHMHLGTRQASERLLEEIRQLRKDLGGRNSLPPTASRTHDSDSASESVEVQ